MVFLSHHKALQSRSRIFSATLSSTRLINQIIYLGMDVGTAWEMHWSIFIYLQCACVCSLSSVCWPTATASWNTTARPCAPRSWNPSKSHTHTAAWIRGPTFGWQLWDLAVIVTAHVYAWCGAPQQNWWSHASPWRVCPLVKVCEQTRIKPRMKSHIKEDSSNQQLSAQCHRANNNKLIWELMWLAMKPKQPELIKISI